MKTNKLLLTAAMLAGCLNLASCDSSEDMKGNVERKEIQLDPDTRAVADNLQEYYVNVTRDFAGYVDSINSKKNNSESGSVILSPISISMALSMFANGVDDNLKSEILNYLGLTDIQSLNTLNKALLRELPLADRKSVLELNNALWYQKDFDLTSEYENLMINYYRAYFKNTDFLRGGSIAADEINGWATQTTHGLINNITNQEQLANTYIFLINALYFKALWGSDLFAAKDTKPSIFHAYNGKEQNIMLMHSDLVLLDYAFNLNFEYVSVEYGNGAFKLELLLPSKELSLEESKKALTGDRLRHLRKISDKTRLYVSLPKIKFDNKHELTEIMDYIGFKSHRNTELTMFAKPTKSGVNYEHFTSFEISEDGVEAAAITTTVAPSLGAGPLEIPDLRFDRPFYFFITEYSTGACILSGRIADIPSAK